MEIHISGAPKQVELPDKYQKNVMTDEEYREYGIDFGSLGYAGNVYGEPRTYGLDLVYRYN